MNKSHLFTVVEVNSSVILKSVHYLYSLMLKQENNLGLIQTKQSYFS